MLYSMGSQRVGHDLANNKIINRCLLLEALIIGVRIGRVSSLLFKQFISQTWERKLKEKKAILRAS